MKKYLFFLILVSSIVYSQTMRQKIQQNVDEKKLSATEGLYLEALAFYSPESLPANWQAQAIQTSKCGFGLNYRINHDWDAFNSNQKKVLQSLLFRPDMPFSHISPLGLFKVHYDTTGYHAVNTLDVDHSGVPDYVEKVAVIMDSVYNLEVNTLGYNPPPSDLDHDGSEWDVYIRNIAYYGSTDIDNQLSHNPDTYASYIYLDNNYTHTYTKGLDGLRVTAAHEFFHMIQLGYNGRDDDNDGWFDDQFFMEASSTWMEDVAYDDINDYINYLSRFFNRTNLPLHWMDGWREYGLSIWLHFLEKRTEGRDVIRLIWDEIVHSQVLPSLSHVLEGYNSSLGEELAQFYTWNYFTGERADTLHFYPEGDMYPEIRLDGVFQLEADTSFITDVVSTGARYYQCLTEDETVYTFIVSNIETFEDDTTTECSLSFKVGGNYLNYIDLGKDIKARHFSEDQENWKTQVIIEDPTQGVLITTLNPNSTETDVLSRIACYPNPFHVNQHDGTVIPFQLDQSGDVTIWIANVSGHRIFEKKINGYRGQINQFQWDGKDYHGNVVPTGIYLYVIRMNSKIVKRDKIAVIH